MHKRTVLLILAFILISLTFVNSAHAFTLKDFINWIFNLIFPPSAPAVTGGVLSSAACDSSSYTSCASAYNFGSSSGSKDNMCGSEQYYTVSAPTGKKCKVTWTVSSFDSDYKLYVKWSADCPSTSNYDSSPSGASSAKDGVVSSYALVKKVSGSGNYTISVRVENCVDAGCIWCWGYTHNDCWRKMKDENCNDLEWYDFEQTTVFPKCAIGVSNVPHYDFHPLLTIYWCPETEAMWKSIKCGGGWPSGSFNEGDTCKVWINPTTWRQGVWDPDDRYCIITHPDSDYPTGGCTIDHRESTVNGVVDTCGGRFSGDAKCEQACGADAACDEEFPGRPCGNGRCTYDCKCCKASDSDGGKNYAVKGTTTGIVYEKMYYEGLYKCKTEADSCVNSTTVREYYINDMYLDNEDYDCSKENKICYDGHCVQPSFTYTNFNCDSNSKQCSMRYTNQIGERVIVRFYLINPTSKEVKDYEDRELPEGSGNLTTSFSCRERGQYDVMFQVFRKSNEYRNPILSPTESRTIRC